MSLLLEVECPNSLSVADVLRLVSEIDGDNRIHIRTVTDPGAVLTPLATCSNTSNYSVGDILRSALVVDTSDGKLKLLVT